MQDSKLEVGITKLSKLNIPDVNAIEYTVVDDKLPTLSQFGQLMNIDENIACTVCQELQNVLELIKDRA